LEILSRQNCRIQIVTKSDLVIRDVDLLNKVQSMVALSITSDDDRVSLAIEPNAPSSSKRLQAVENLVKKGIPVAVRIDPIIPFVNDNCRNLVRTLASLGVKHITSSTYKVMPDNWVRFSAALPTIAEKLKPIYFGRGQKIGRYTYLPKDWRFELMQRVGDLAAEYDMKFAVCREGFTYLNTATCDGSWLFNRFKNLRN